MNKQEMKDKLTKLIDKKGNYNAYSLNSKQRLNAVGYFEGITAALKLVEKLDEPELPVIPQFVADWIEFNKDKFNIYGAYSQLDKGLSIELKKVYDWVFNKFNHEPFARAWLDGYTIEPEPMKTRQVLVKFFDNEEYKTELTEESARELIEFLEANKNE